MLSRSSLVAASGPFLLASGFAIAGVGCLLGSSTGSLMASASETASVSVGAVGAGSCAASSCHGAPREHGVNRSEYGIWATFDKHASAYSVLFDDRSKQIEAAYSHKSLKDARAEKDQLCLKCHGLEGGLARAELQVDGVSCESCHGPAKAWLNQHYLLDWHQRPAADKAALGFIDTHDLYQRGKACAACHVGDGTKEVNHDLVAAGHPRLQFEYSAFLATEVKHWDAAAEKRRFPDLEIRTWALGQLLSAQAALELLATRAEDKSATRTSLEPRPWPEFAEYDCFACHHDLKSQSWRAAERLRPNKEVVVGAKETQPGMLDWGSWYTPQLSNALKASGSSQREQIEETISNLHKAMGTSQNRQGVADEARKAARMLGKAAEMLASEKSNLKELDNLIDVLHHPKDNRAELTWDRATQMYLGLAAAVNARNDLQPNRKDPGFQERVRAIATLLRFPSRPKDAQPKDALQFDSPSNFNPQKVREAFQDLEPGNPK